jgi:hypothetical protein
MGQAYRYPPDVAFYIFFTTNISTEYFKHAAHSPFWPDWTVFKEERFYFKTLNQPNIQGHYIFIIFSVIMLIAKEQVCAFC